MTKKPDFKKDQIWRTRDGDYYVKITSVQDPLREYPIVAKFCDGIGRDLCYGEETYTRHGKRFSWTESDGDLVELVELVEPSPTPSPQFKVGQVWKTREGKYCFVKRITKDTLYGVTAVYCDKDGARKGCITADYTFEGLFLAGQKNLNDLVELVIPAPEDREQKLPELPKKFRVGQVWELRNGEQFTITAIDDHPVFPIEAVNGSQRLLFTFNGGYSAERRPCDRDLVKLISEPKPASTPSPQFKVGQVWESRNGEQFTITVTDGHPTYPIEAISGSCHLRFSSNGGFWTSLPSDRDLVKLISEPESEPIASPPELQAIFNGEKPVYVVVAEDGGIYPGTSTVLETSINSINSFASFREALERQRSLSNCYGTTYIAECRIILATRFDK